MDAFRVALAHGLYMLFGMVWCMYLYKSDPSFKSWKSWAVLVGGSIVVAFFSAILHPCQ